MKIRNLVLGIIVGLSVIGFTSCMKCKQCYRGETTTGVEVCGEDIKKFEEVGYTCITE